MKVQYELNREDFIAFNLYHMIHSPALGLNRRGQRLVLLIVAEVLGLVILFDPQPFTVSYFLVWCIIGVLLILIFCVPFMSRHSTRKVAAAMFNERKNQASRGTSEIRLSPMEIIVRDGLSSASIRWDAVEKIVEDVSYIYIYLSATEALIIPRRAFPGAAEFTTFAATARKYLAAAATGSATGGDIEAGQGLFGAQGAIASLRR
jgi:hypothetical protein